MATVTVPSWALRPVLLSSCYKLFGKRAWPQGLEGVCLPCLCLYVSDVQDGWKAHLFGSFNGNSGSWRRTSSSLQSGHMTCSKVKLNERDEPEALTECGTVNVVDESNIFFCFAKILFKKTTWQDWMCVVWGEPQMANLFSYLVCFKNWRHSLKESIDIHCLGRLNAMYY